MLLNLVTGIAVACAAVAVFLPAAQAAPGVVTSNVNVRSGPGTNYAAVDTILRGTPVDVQRCDGSWCYVAKSGPDGWISAAYLSAGGRPVNPTQPGLSFDFPVGPNGPDINIGVGRAPGAAARLASPGRPPAHRSSPAGRAGKSASTKTPASAATAAAMRKATRVRDLGRFSDRFSSIDNPERLEVQVCAERNLRDCRTYTTSASSLGDFNGVIRSIRDPLSVLVNQYLGAVPQGAALFFVRHKSRLDAVTRPR